MRLTDLFVKRPVLAIVVNLVILIAGPASHPLAQRAPISAQRHCGGAGFDGVCGRQRRSRARVYHHAAGARHRERRRHRLPGVVERAGRQHDHRAPEAELRHQRGADADPVEGGAGAQPASAGSGSADHRPADGGHPVRRGVPRLLLARPRSEPDHRLSDARRAAEAERHQRRAARGDLRRPHVRHARLAQAGEDGRSRHLALAVRDALAANNYLSALGRPRDR